MGKGDGQRPRFVPYDQYASNYDRIFGNSEQKAPHSAPWDDEMMDECPVCFEIDCICDWQRIEDEYRED